MPANRKPTPQEKLEAARAAAPEYWRDLEAADIPQDLNAEAAANPFLTETTDLLRFYFPPNNQMWGSDLSQALAFSRDQSGQWHCNHPNLKTGKPALAGLLRRLWNHRIRALEMRIFDLSRRRNVNQTAIYLNHDSPLYQLNEAIALTAAVGGASSQVPDFSALASRLQQMLNPDREPLAAEYAGANPPAGMNGYCRRYANALNACRKLDGPMALQYWLLNIAVHQVDQPPPDPLTIREQAIGHFRESLKKQGGDPEGRRWNYHCALPPRLLLSPQPPTPQDTAELHDLLQEDPPHHDLYRVFAKRKSHPLRKAKLNPDTAPQAQAWFRWLNERLQAAADPAPLLVVLELLTYASQEAALAVNDLFRQPSLTPPELHRRLAQALNPGGCARTATARQERSAARKDQEARLTAAAHAATFPLAAAVKTIAAANIKLEKQADGRVKFLPEIQRALPWIYKTGDTGAQRQQQLLGNMWQFELTQFFSRIVTAGLRQVSPEWRQLTPEAAELAWRKLTLNGGRQWTEWIADQKHDFLDRLLHRSEPLFDPRLIKELSRLLPKSQLLTLAHYNAAVAAGPAWPELVKTNPAAAAWWLSGGDRRRPVNHIGQIISQCRKEFAAAGGHSWKTLSRSPLDQLLVMLGPQPMANQDDRRRQELAWLLNRLPQDPKRQAMPDLDTAKLLGNLKEERIHHSAALAQLFLLEYNRCGGIWPTARDELNDLKDWARNLPIHQPLPARTWRRALRRSAAWHREYAEHRIQEQRRKLLAERDGQLKSWTSALPQWTDPQTGWTLQSLENEADLMAESELMRHCVGGQYYSDRCYEGHCRIYHVDTGQSEYTVELLTDPKAGRSGVLGCSPGQIRGPQNQAAPKPVQQAAARLAAAYKESQARLPARHHQGYWSKSPTGSVATQSPDDRS